MVQYNYQKLVYEDFVEQFEKFFVRVNNLRKTMLKQQAESLGPIDNYESILLDMFQTSREVFDYMVMCLRFFISAYLK